MRHLYWQAFSLIHSLCVYMCLCVFICTWCVFCKRVCVSVSVCVCGVCYLLWQKTGCFSHLQRPSRLEFRREFPPWQGHPATLARRRPHLPQGRAQTFHKHFTRSEE